jgi:hypothetical protein
MHRRDVPERRSSRRRTLLSSEERTRLPSPNSGENRSSKAAVGTSSKAEAATAHSHTHAAAASKNPALTAMAGRIAAGCLSAPDLTSSSSSSSSSSASSSLSPLSPPPAPASDQEPNSDAFLGLGLANNLGFFYTRSRYTGRSPGAGGMGGGGRYAAAMRCAKPPFLSARPPRRTRSTC